MFTGIIEATAKILEKADSGLLIERPQSFDDTKVGCSIAVSGVCLTVTVFDQESMRFDVVPTTFEKTKFRSLRKGDMVNLERAMKANGRFEGHIVLGHSEGVGIVIAVSEELLTITIPSDLLSYIIPHGSITLDGVALTVAEITADIVTVALIPHTFSQTTLGSLKAGDRLNIETDILGKYILSVHGHR